MPVDASLLIPGADDHADPIHHDNECGQKQQGYRKNGAGCRHSIFSPNEIRQVAFERVEIKS